MDVGTNCSQQTFLFSPLRRPRTLSCSLLALTLSLFVPHQPPHLSQVFFTVVCLACTYAMAGCTISVFSQRPSSPKAYSPDVHTCSPHTTAIWLEL
ncbi:hypothetical protein C8J57DRAFT_1540826 [Mycena rebaudengoi]|nr:hypothetical protein C8J57DRAFT_1540826 [Mycena rebaudengoi]